MAAEYSVRYDIEVFSSTAIQSINKFKTSLNSLAKATRPLTDLQRQVRSLNETLSGLKSHSIQFNTTQAKRQLTELLTIAQEIRTTLASTTVGGRASRSSRTASRTSTAAAGTTTGHTGHMPLVRNNTPSTASRSTRSSRSTTGRSYTGRPTSYGGTWPAQPRNLGYKLLGPTPLPSNGGMAIDMLKGMGIAYGIAGLGQMFGNIVSQATEYDNTMKTVENILKSHDFEPDFAKRFQQMTGVVRNVGMETKFKVTEVADAAKFLAMAGLNAESISKAIRPIADIALVGDTELGETADVVTNIMTAYNIKPDQMRRAADVMTNTFTMSNTTLMEMAEAYKYSAALLSAGNVNFSESAAALGVLGDAGIKGSQAGTTMRTIMANVLNPTKKQAAAWKEIGISTQGKNLLTIFEELKAKDLDAGTYYRLFHKTAASGAVALAAHSDKWRNVYNENLLSNGLSARLADEKKNTLQGLWAQLVSVFTDDGVKAFAGIQGTLRNFLKQTTNWLKTADAQKIITDLFKTFKEFGVIIIDATKKFYAFYQAFKPFLIGWMKFQLTIWPFVKAFQALKTVLLSLAAIRGNVLGTAGFFGLLGGGANTSGRGLLGAATGGATLYAGPMKGLPGVTKEQIVAASAGLDRTNSNWRRTRNWRLAKAQMGTAGRAIGGTAVGMGLMGLGINELMDEEGNGWNTASGALYTVAGAAAMVGGPWGWGIAAGAALLGTITHFIAKAQQIRDIIEKFSEFAAANKIINGVFTKTENTELQYMELMLNKNKDINDLIQQRIELTEKLLGLNQEQVDSTGVSDLFEDTAKAFVKTTGGIKIDDFGDTIEAVTNAFKQWDSTSTWTYSNGVDDYGAYYTNANGDKIRLTASDKYNAPELLAYTGAAVQAAINGSTYQNKLLELRQGVPRRLLQNMNQAEWETFWTTLEHENNPAYIQGLNRGGYNFDYWNEEEAMKNFIVRSEMWEQYRQPFETMKNAVMTFIENKQNGLLTVYDILDVLTDAYGGEAGDYLKNFSPYNTASWLSSLGFWDGTFHEANGRDPERNAQVAYSAMQSIKEALVALGVEGEPAAEGIISIINYMMGQAEAFLGTGEAIIGEYDGQIKEFGNLTLQWDATNSVWNQIVNDNVQYVSTLSGSMFSLNSSIWGLGNTIGGYDWGSMWNSMLPRFSTTDFSGFGLGAGFNFAGSTLSPTGSLGTSWNFSSPLGFTGYKFGSTGFGNFGKFNFSSGLGTGTGFGRGGLFGGGNNMFKTTTTTASFTPTQVGNLAGYRNTNGTSALDGSGTGTGTGTHTHTPRVSNNDYKSKYNNNSAAPKQVIVNIENLMNVDKVDLRNPDNVAVINDLKSQLTQALVDVVHDFDETWHG